jgi:two-component system, LytTR family, response regulator
VDGVPSLVDAGTSLVTKKRTPARTRPIIEAMIRVLIVDDEPDARERIRRLLALHPDLEIVGEAADGEQALHAMEEQRVDIAFLDIQMPHLDGLGVAELIPPDRMPVLVFVTAFDEYALRAFEAHAVDYLLKPYDRQRFDRALAKARTYLSGRGHVAGVRALVSSVRGTPYRKRIAVRSRDRTFVLRVDTIDWIEAQGSYVRLHTARQGFLIRESMRDMESSLDPARFLRVHRSSIVNIDRIEELKTDAHGELRLLLAGGVSVTVGRVYRAAVESALGLKI